MSHRRFDLLTKTLVQTANNLNPVIFWTNLGNGTGDASGLFQFIDPGASNRPMRFYHAVSP